MRETIKEWKDEWIETNGETDELEVIIADSIDDIYEGSFMNIPEALEEKKVISCGKILNSTISNRIGAYSLKVWKEYIMLQVELSNNYIKLLEQKKALEWQLDHETSETDKYIHEQVLDKINAKLDEKEFDYFLHLEQIEQM